MEGCPPGCPPGGYGSHSHLGEGQYWSLGNEAHWKQLWKVVGSHSVCCFQGGRLRFESSRKRLTPDGHPHKLTIVNANEVKSSFSIEKKNCSFVLCCSFNVRMQLSWKRCCCCNVWPDVCVWIDFKLAVDLLSGVWVLEQQLKPVSDWKCFRLGHDKQHFWLAEEEQSKLIDIRWVVRNTLLEKNDEVAQCLRAASTSLASSDFLLVESNQAGSDLHWSRLFA